jgi:Zn-dependent protease
MPTGRQGSIRLFRLAGIDVFLHWSWFLVAVYEIQSRAGMYSSVGWNIAEYLALFLIVLTHEFGHALACRQVGGRADRIVLWPLGGVAYVDPPQRPGATLWSIVAGPLVNVAFIPVFWILLHGGAALGWSHSMPDVFRLIYGVGWINIWLLVFNIVPVYPLDGGKILWALLWFPFGRARSLMIATVIGLLGIGGFIVLAIYRQDRWLGIVAFFMLLNCWSGLQQARAMLRLAKLPTRLGFSCPNCKTSPPIGDLWTCGRCGNAFDMFGARGMCPSCSTQYPSTTCMNCGRQSAIEAWSAPSYIDAQPTRVV